MADGTTKIRARGSEAIRRNIEGTRADMDDTIDAIGDRLSPGRLVDEAWHRIRDGDGVGLTDALKDHPMPVALMGLGLGWLAVEQAFGHSLTPGGRSHDGSGTGEPAEGRRGPYGSEAVDHGDAEWEHASRLTKLKGKVTGGAGAIEGKASRGAASVKEKASHAASSVKDKASHAASSMKEKVSATAGSTTEGVHSTADSARERGSDFKERAAEKASDAASRAREGARRAGERTRQGFWSLMEESPLAVGAIAFGLGLASGVSTPSTGVEDRLMGRTSDTLKDDAKRVAKDSSEKAKLVAEDAAEAAADEIERQGDRRDIEGEAREVKAAAQEGVAHTREAVDHAAAELKEAAKDVGRAAKEAAVSRAKDEHLTAEGFEAEAKKAGEKAKEQATRDARRSRPKSMAPGD